MYTFLSACHCKFSTVFYHSCTSAAFAVIRCLAGCLSRSFIVSKRLKIVIWNATIGNRTQAILVLGFKRKKARKLSHLRWSLTTHDRIYHNLTSDLEPSKMTLTLICDLDMQTRPILFSNLRKYEAESNSRLQ